MCEPHFAHNVTFKFYCDVGRGIFVARRGTKSMQIFIAIVAIWLGLNLAIVAFIQWQRSPHFRHRVSRLTLGMFVPKQTSAHRRHLMGEKPIDSDLSETEAGLARL